MNSKIFLSALSIFAATAIAGAATYALFTASAGSVGNTFAAGTLNLTLDDVDETTPAPTVIASFNLPNMIPGVTAPAQFISMHNSGSIDIAKIKFGTVQDSSTGAGNMANVVQFAKVRTGSSSSCSGSDIGPTIAAKLSVTPPFTLADLQAHGPYDSLPGVDTAGTKYLCINFGMDAAADNSYQGASTTQTFTFEASQ